MKSEELADIFGAMTTLPWHVDDDTPVIYSGDTEVIVIGDEANNYDGDAHGVVTLANHANAFVPLVAACESLVSTLHPFDVPARLEQLAAALAAVHAIGREP